MLVLKFFHIVKLKIEHKIQICIFLYKFQKSKVLFKSLFVGKIY